MPPMKIENKRMAVILVVLLAMAAVGGGYYWYTTRGVEDTGGKTEGIPDPVPNPGPITTGSNDWPCRGGHRHDNRSDVKGIRTDWSGGLKMLWDIHYLCQGRSASTWSAPAVAGNRLVVPGRNEGSDMIFCLDPEAGRLLWFKSYPADTDDEHGPGSRATPCIDADRVYTFGRGGDLACWKLRDGELLWRRNVQDDGGKIPRWGLSSSPLVHDGNVIVQGGGSATAIAYDKMTGKAVWKWQGPDEGDAGYATVRAMPVEQDTHLLVFHATGLAALRPADGSGIWNVPWRTGYGVNAATPVVVGDMVFITSDYNKGCAAIEVAPTQAEMKWSNREIQSHHSDPVVVDGYAYGYSGKGDQNKGYLVCVRLSDGQRQWRTREAGHGTIVQVDGHLLCLDGKGNLDLVKPDPKEFRKVAEMPAALPDVGGYSWTAPVIANGKLYLRYRQALICYDLINK